MTEESKFQQLKNLFYRPKHNFEFTPDEKAQYSEWAAEFRTSSPDQRALLYPGIDDEKALAQKFIQNTLKDREVAAEMIVKEVEQERTALEVLQSVFPDKKFVRFPNHGSSCFLYSEESDSSKLYKVSRDTRKPEAFKREAAIMKQLMSTGLSPNFFGYHEVNGREVLVMEKIDFHEEGVQTLQRDLRLQEASRITSTLERYNLYPADVEFVFDKHKKQIRIIDCGGFISPEDSNDTISNRVLFKLFKW